MSLRRVNPELFGEKDDKNFKDFHANAAPGKESCKESRLVSSLCHTTHNTAQEKKCKAEHGIPISPCAPTLLRVARFMKLSDDWG